MARLTKKERKILVNTVINNIENMGEMSYPAFLQYLEDNSNIANLNMSNINPILTRIDEELLKKDIKYIVERKESYRKGKTLAFMSAEYVYIREDTFTKDKNILYFNCCKGLTYDFITKKFNINLDSIYHKPWNFKQYLDKLLKYEWLFNYTDNLDIIADIVTGLDNNDIEVMPKGFYEVLKENDLSYNLLKDFIYKQKFGKYYRFATEGIGTSRAKDFINVGGKLETLIKLAKNSVENGDLYLDDDIKFLVDTFIEVKELFNPNVTLDTNRDVQYNLQYLEDIKDREKNQALAEKLQKLNFINNFEKNGLVVVVPQNQEEKRAEGTMQNNCVGHYYDDSILEGRNLIYFIRKADKKDKSYITCRYNKGERRTVEYKAFNNNMVTDKNAISFIHEIDKIIQENLK